MATAVKAILGRGGRRGRGEVGLRDAGAADEGGDALGVLAIRALLGGGRLEAGDEAVGLGACGKVTEAVGAGGAVVVGLLQARGHAGLLAEALLAASK